jgi:hypothetical protein
MRFPINRSYTVVRRQSVLEGNAELLVYLVEEEKDIYIGGHLRPVQLGSAQLSPSAASLSPNLYELANGGHAVVYMG